MAEAQGYADESWGTRWVPVAKAIRFIESGGQRPPGPQPGGSLQVPDTNEPPQGEPLADPQPQQQAPDQQQPQQQPGLTCEDLGTLTINDVIQANTDVQAGTITRDKWRAIMDC